jgi:hypothetical protein
VDVTISNGAPTTIYFLPRFKNITAMTVSSVRVGVSTVSEPAWQLAVCFKTSVQLAVTSIECAACVHEEPWGRVPAGPSPMPHTSLHRATAQSTGGSSA